MSTKSKKKGGEGEGVNGKDPNTSVDWDSISSNEGLRDLLRSVRDRMVDGSAAPIYAMSVMFSLQQNQAMYQYLSAENKEIARDIWLRLKQGGMQLKNPPLLFSEGESDLVASQA